MHPFKVTVSFRVRHPLIDPAEISKALNLVPSRQWKNATQRTTPTGELLAGIYSGSYCTFAVIPPGEIGLSELIQHFCETRLLNIADLLRRIADSGGASEFFIGWFAKENSGETFGADLLSLLSQLRVGLSFDFYPEEPRKKGSNRKDMLPPKSSKA